VLAGAAALLVAELVARAAGSTGPVVAVGNAVVSLAPPSARDAGIGLFGTLDKPLLVGGVLLVCAALAAQAGRLHRRSRVRAALLIAALSVLAATAVAADPGGGGVAALAVGAALLLTGVLLLDLLLAPASRPTPEGRRQFLQRAALLGVLVVAGGTLLRALDGSAVVQRARAALRLPVPGRRALGNPVTTELGLPGLTPLVTPNARFYRIDTALVVPQVDPQGWTLSVDGMVDRPLQLSLEDLLALPQVEADITLQCVSNEVGGNLVGLARWQGVLLSDLLERAGASPSASQVVGVSVDGFTGGFPTSYATDGRPSMVALGMNGELLPVQHGFPARLVVPGLYGYVSATKWLRSVTLTTWEGFDGFWVPRGWSKLGPIKVASRIDVPADGATVAAGTVTVAGMAWAPGRGRGITSVQVRVDEAGPWLEAELGGALSEDAWRQWRLEWQATPGEHLLQVRATDRPGKEQDARLAPPRPDGATGLHDVRVLVRA